MTLVDECSQLSTPFLCTNRQWCVQVKTGPVECIVHYFAHFFRRLRMVQGVHVRIAVRHEFVMSNLLHLLCQKSNGYSYEPALIVVR